MSWWDPCRTSFPDLLVCILSFPENRWWGQDLCFQSLSCCPNRLRRSYRCGSIFDSFRSRNLKYAVRSRSDELRCSSWKDLHWRAARRSYRHCLWSFQHRWHRHYPNLFGQTSFRAFVQYKHGFLPYLQTGFHRCVWKCISRFAPVPDLFGVAFGLLLCPRSCCNRSYRGSSADFVSGTPMPIPHKRSVFHRRWLEVCLPLPAESKVPGAVRRLLFQQRLFRHLFYLPKQTFSLQTRWVLDEFLLPSLPLL